MIGNGFWSTINLSIRRYADNINHNVPAHFVFIVSFAMLCCLSFLKLKENRMQKVWYIWFADNVLETDTNSFKLHENDVPRTFWEHFKSSSFVLSLSFVSLFLCPSAAVSGVKGAKQVSVHQCNCLHC